MIWIRTKARHEDEAVVLGRDDEMRSEGESSNQKKRKKSRKAREKGKDGERKGNER